MPKPDVPLRQYAWVVKLRPGGRRVVRRAGRNGAEPRRRRLFGRGVGHSYQCPALTACDLDTQPGRLVLARVQLGVVLPRPALQQGAVHDQLGYGVQRSSTVGTWSLRAWAIRGV